MGFQLPDSGWQIEKREEESTHKRERNSNMGQILQFLESLGLEFQGEALALYSWVLDRRVRAEAGKQGFS